MLNLTNIDLRHDPAAGLYLKNETVQVSFAQTNGELTSQEGPNRYKRGDALIIGSTGNRWCVSRDRFDAKYEPVSPVEFGQDGAYRNKPIPVLAKQIQEPFSIARSAGGDLLHGHALDWVMQYALNDFGIIDNERFQLVYKRVNTKP